MQVSPRQAGLRYRCRPMRPLTAALLLLLLCLASGAGPGDCVTGCSEDDVGGSCPPSCTHCICCSHAPAPALLLDSGVTPVLGYERRDAIGSGEPSPGSSADIFHVPRLRGLSA